MMNTKKVYDSRVAPLVMRCCAVLVFAAGMVAGQSRIIPPETQPIIAAQPQPTPVPSPQRPHVATLRSTDSAEGSRVALTSDQSLRDYEAYRRGDRFFVRIPGADISRAEAVRGKAFTDVRAQRTGDTTLVSFRLQPGATAHVEQRSNRLDIVIALPGTTSPVAVANVGASGVPYGTSTPTIPNRQSAVARESQNASTSRSAKPSPTPGTTARPSPTPSTAATPAQKASPVTSPAAANESVNPEQPQSNQSGWGSFKERMHYWILFAQLNPIPVSIGVAVLLLLVGLFFYNRGRTTAGGEGLDQSKLKSAEAGASGAATKPAAEEVTVAALSEQAPASAVAKERATPEPAADPRQLLINRVSAEAKKVFAGENYDPDIIGSSDAATRELVAAELLSSLVGRDAQRRERARNAFMDHGYFDDATRDLRIAESSNERAAAARRLSLVRTSDATPHLIAALGDSSTDVRRAAIAALRDAPDPAAIPALNALMQTETDDHVPRNLIKQAIEACATSSPEDTSTRHAADVAGAVIAESSYRPETEREVFEL